MGHEHVHPAVLVSSTYENVSATCPWCSTTSTFNRRSDLNDVDSFANKTVRCLANACEKQFAIIGDSVNEAFEMLVYDTYELANAKHYMSCILNLTQAYEVFFATFLRVHYAYRPYASDRYQGLGKLNTCLDELSNQTRRWEFLKLRSAFLRRAAIDPPQDLTASYREIQSADTLAAEPSDEDITACSDKTLTQLLLKTKHSHTNVLRNRVVHQRAYRPTKDEVAECLNETRTVLLPLGHYLDVHDDANWYVWRANHRH